MRTTVTTELVHHGERRDRAGRQHVPRERREQLVAAFRESGLTRRAFARRDGIRYTTFCNWTQHAAKRAGAGLARGAGALCGGGADERERKRFGSAIDRRHDGARWQRRGTRRARAGVEELKRCWPSHVRSGSSWRWSRWTCASNTTACGARSQLGENPKEGAVFCFTNRERTRLKLLYWDGTGVWVLAKRLEQERFPWPEPSEAKRKLALTPEALALIVGGVDLKTATLKPWYDGTKNNITRACPPLPRRSTKLRS